ncbi:hypothetical protein OXIME_000429 [Oxyplasma meridianum]|uniref:Uncharacterized protein n=1 Tax=Oxyplasma meridianum TaxID=3073602 RepID=A0AAX4NFC4_9ARCH
MSRIDNAGSFVVAIISGIVAVKWQVMGLSDIFMIVPIISGLFAGVLLVRRDGKRE